MFRRNLCPIAIFYNNLCRFTGFLPIPEWNLECPPPVTNSATRELNITDRFRRIPLIYTKCNRLFRILPCIVMAGLICSADSVSAQLIDDFMFRVSDMSIDRVEVGGKTKRPDFNRRNVEIGLGMGPITLGAIYQATDKGPATVPGLPDYGLMITAGYTRMFHSNISLDVYSRIGVLSQTPRSDPLYPTDTDIRTKLVVSHPDGVGFLSGKPFFPSFYVGFMMNQYGRFQGLGGTGVWWRGVGLYLTAFRAVNGVNDPENPGRHESIIMAHLKNAGVNFIVSYEFRDILFEIKKNYPYGMH